MNFKYHFFSSLFSLPKGFDPISHSKSSNNNNTNINNNVNSLPQSNTTNNSSKLSNSKSATDIMFGTSSSSAAAAAAAASLISNTNSSKSSHLMNHHNLMLNNNHHHNNNNLPFNINSLSSHLSHLTNSQIGHHSHIPSPSSTSANTQASLLPPGMPPPPFGFDPSRFSKWAFRLLLLILL